MNPVRSTTSMSDSRIHKEAKALATSKQPQLRTIDKKGIYLNSGQDVKNAKQMKCLEYGLCYATDRIFPSQSL